MRLADTDTVRFETTIEVPKQRLRDLLCSAVEGGTNYWAQVSDLDRDEPDLEYNAATFHELTDDDSGYVETGVKVTYLSLLRGLQLAASGTYARHFSDFMQENDDATTADVIVQLTIFGEVKYG